MVTLELKNMNEIESIKMKDSPFFQQEIIELSDNKKMSVEKKKILNLVRSKKV